MTVFGPAEDIAVLVGNGNEAAVIIDNGKLKNLTLDSFTFAITVRATGELENVRVRSSRVAVRAETAAKLSVSSLDITGASSACAKGVELIGNAVLTATDLRGRRLGTSLDVRDQASANISGATLIGDKSCITNTISASSSGEFTLTDSIVIGSHAGLALEGANDNAPLHATLSNVTIRDMELAGLGGRNAVVRMNGGELSLNGSSGLAISSGSWSLTDVAVIDNPNDGADLLGRQGQMPVVLTMRGCTISGNLHGIALSDFAIVDLGTAQSPGNNILRLNRGVGLLLSGEDDRRETSAVGNTWQPFIQGADEDGQYSPTTISGPVNFVNGNNFAIRTATRSLKL